MGSFSIWHWLIVLAVALLLFGGGGKIKKIMGDVGSGITAFKKGLKDSEKEGDDNTKADRKSLDDGASTSASVSENEEKDKAASG